MSAAPSPLRARMAAIDETVFEVEAAARDRLYEATDLFWDDQFHASVYWFGLTAEMLLKTAYARLDPAWNRINDLRTAAVIPARVVLQHLYARHRPAQTPPPHEAFHSIAFWRDCLVLKRLDLGRPLASRVGAELRNRTDRLYETWWIEGRYRASMATRAEAAAVLADVSWLEEHHDDLWR